MPSASYPRADETRWPCSNEIHDQGGVQLRDRANLLRARPEHDASYANARVSRDLTDVREMFLRVGKQRFGRPIRLEAPAGVMTGKQTSPHAPMLGCGAYVIHGLVGRFVAPRADGDELRRNVMAISSVCERANVEAPAQLHARELLWRRFHSFSSADKRTEPCVCANHSM